MGITSLLPFLEHSTRPCHVSQFRGLTVAVDSYCWLHKGARGCALQLAKGEPTDIFVAYCLKYVKMLLSYDIKPIMVFDGRHLPAKLPTEQKRRESKKHARKEGIELLRLGKVEEACKFFKQCVDVNPIMALMLIKECRKLNVDCIVAPYEADAQLAFFSIKGIAECVITEDSDLLLFGCQKVLYKLDFNGNGQLVEADKINQSMRLRGNNYSFDKFRLMCILSGCDYTDSLPGIGLKKALKFIGLTAETDPEIFLDRIPKYLKMRQLVVTPEYKESFMVANATFKHQTVFDPEIRQLVPLTPVEGKVEYCRNAGDFFDNTAAFQLALGNLDPLSLESIDNWNPAKVTLSDYSIWSHNFKRREFVFKTPVVCALKKRKVPDDAAEMSELVKNEHDEGIRQALEFYKTAAAVEPSREVVVKEPVVACNQTNPFVKKKISKFGVTEAPPNVVTVSRFFPDTAKEGDGCGKPVFHTPLFNCIGSESDTDEIEESVVELSKPVEIVLTPDLPILECDISELELDEVPLGSVENLPEVQMLKKRKVLEVPPIVKVHVKKQKKPRAPARKQPRITDMFRRMPK